MIVTFYTPTPGSGIKEANHVDVLERQDNQVVEFTFALFKKMYSDHPHMSWYLKLDDDSLLFPTNFMHHLASLNPNQAVMGGHLKYDGIFSGGAGYFLSNSVLQMLVERASECLKQHVPNRLLGGPEDVIVSLCVKHFFGDQLVQVHIQEMYPLTYENMWYPQRTRTTWTWRMDCFRRPHVCSMVQAS